MLKRLIIEDITVFVLITFLVIILMIFVIRVVSLSLQQAQLTIFLLNVQDMVCTFHTARKMAA